MGQFADVAGARVTEMRYEHERGMFQVAYEGIEGQRSHTSPGAGCSDPNGASGDAEGALTALGSSSMHTIKCGIRCGTDTWATSSWIRHRLEEGGGGL